MVPTTRFSYEKEQRHDYIQPECPVYVHCTRQCTDLPSGMRFLQLRMVNRGEHTVKTVMFCIEGVDDGGEVCYTLRGLVMGGCNAPPQSVFGEGRLFVLRQTAQHIRIRIEQVVFVDGMSWRRQSGQKLLQIEKSDWKRCPCSMPNAPENEQCVLCGKRFDPPEQRHGEESPAMHGEQVVPPQPICRERPKPIVRENNFVADKPNDEEDEGERVPVWLVVLLAILGAFALTALLYFGINLFGSGRV